MEAYYSIIQKENEYRILLTPINTPIQLDNYENGVGYSLFFHFIARDNHCDIVEMLKADIREVSGK